MPPARIQDLEDGQQQQQNGANCEAERLLSGPTASGWPAALPTSVHIWTSTTSGAVQQQLATLNKSRCLHQLAAWKCSCCQQVAAWQSSCQGATLRTRLTVLVCIIFCSAALAQYVDAQQLQALIEGLHEAKLASIVVFVLLFAVAVVLMLPGMLLCMGAGAAYGFYLGCLVGWVASVLGQVGAFMLGRYLMRDVVYSYMVKRVPGFAAIDHNISEDGWKVVLLLRLSPVLPYNIMNYVLGVSSINLMPYTLASAVAAIPYICIFTYLGSASTDLYQLLHDGASAHLSPEWLIVIACVMILSAVGLFFVFRHAVMAVPAEAAAAVVVTAAADDGDDDDDDDTVEGGVVIASRVAVISRLQGSSSTGSLYS